MEVNTQHRCFLGGVTLGEEREDHAGEYIAAACRCHARVARVVEEHRTIGHRHGGVSAFQHDDDAILHCLLAEQRKPFKRVGGLAEHALKFLGMGREDGLRRQERKPGLVFTQNVECIGVHHQRYMGILNQLTHHTIIRGAQSRAHTDGVESIHLVVGMNHRLRQ